jgi:hypothetical protein
MPFSVVCLHFSLDAGVRIGRIESRIKGVPASPQENGSAVGKQIIQEANEKKKDAARCIWFQPRRVCTVHGYIPEIQSNQAELHEAFHSSQLLHGGLCYGKVFIQPPKKKK